MKTNQPNKATFKYEQEWRFYLEVAKVESKVNGAIKGKRGPLFHYMKNKIVTIDAYKKEILNEFARIRKLTSLSSPWVEKIKTDKIWLCESGGNSRE